MSKIPPGGKDGGRSNENADGTRDALGTDERTPNERPSGKHAAGGASDGGSPGATAAPLDHGATIVDDFIAVGLIDLGREGVGFLARLRDDTEGLRVDTERFRRDTERAGHLLRLFGADVSRPFRLELRAQRKLIEQQSQLIEKRRQSVARLFRVCEIDLPPE